VNEFRRIIEKAIKDAEEVDCSMDEFKLGLVLMFHAVKERMEVEDIDPTDPDILEQVDELEG